MREKESLWYPDMSIIDDERRAYTRFPANLTIRVNNCSRFPGTEINVCLLEDLSFVGAKILSLKSVGEVDDTVELGLRVDSSETILIKGDIVRVDGTEERQVVAIAFRRLGLSDQLGLDRALNFFRQARAGLPPVTAPISPLKKTHQNS